MNFKKISTLCASIAVMVLLLSCNTSTESQITGEITRAKVKKVHLYQVNNGKLQELADTTLDVNNKFSFTFTPQYKGYYVLGFDEFPLAPTNKYKFYFEGGDQLNFQVNDTSYVLTGKNTKENQMLTDWHNFGYVAESQAIGLIYPRDTYVEFFPRIATLSAQSQNWFADKKTGNKTFDKLMENTIRYDVALWAINFIGMPNRINPTPNDYAGTFYQTLNISDYTKDASILEMPFGLRVLQTLASLNARMGKESMQEYSLGNVLATRVADTTVREVMAYDRIMQSSSVEQFKARYEQFNTFILSGEKKTAIETLGKELQAKEDAMAAVDFTYPDAKGKMISLSNFKGKVVVVDFWATWCMPCRRTLPYLVALEKQYHGNPNVVFIGVSVDTEKDKAKWEKMLKEEKLPGVQLFANGMNNTPEAYEVKAIPRFMVFTKTGKLAAAKAPAPAQNDDRLKQIIDKLLTE